MFLVDEVPLLRPEEGTGIDSEREVGMLAVLPAPMQVFAV